MILKFKHQFLSLWNTHPDSELVEKGVLSTQNFVLYQREFMQELLREAIGFAGCKIARRQLGLAGVEDIDGIAHEAAACRLKVLALQIAKEWVIHHQSYHHIDDVIRTIQKHAATYNEKTFPLQSHSNNKNAMTV